MRNVQSCYILFLAILSITGCNQYETPKVINIKLEQIPDSICFEDVFELERIIPLTLPGVSKQPYSIKVEIFDESIFWFGKTEDEPFLFVFKPDGSIMGRIEDYPTMVDIKSSGDGLEILDNNSVHLLNPFGSLQRSDDFLSAFPYSFWRLKTGIVKDGLFHQDTIWEMVGNNDMVPRFVINWDLKNYKIDEKNRISYSARINVGNELLVCSGSFNGKDVRIFCNHTKQETKVFGEIYLENHKIENLPVAGSFDDKLILFIWKENMDKYFPDYQALEARGYVCMLKIK